jgi:hypothetical protein
MKESGKSPVGGVYYWETTREDSKLRTLKPKSEADADRREQKLMEIGQSTKKDISKEEVESK